jgi:hypothetical protein
VQDLAFARSPEEVSKAHTKYGQLVFNSAESKGKRDRVAEESEIRRMKGEAAGLALDKAKVEAAVLTNRMKTVGVMTANGLIGNRTQQQVSESLKSTPGRDKDGSLKYDVENAGQVVQDQLDAFRLGIQVPLYQEPGLIDGASVKNLDYRQMEKFGHAIRNFGFDSRGNLTNDQQSVDPKKTGQIRSEGLDYFAGLGYQVDREGEFFVPPDNPNATILNRALEVMTYTEQLEASQGAAIPSVYDFQSAFKDPASLPPVQGPQAPPQAQREPLATKAATSGRAVREFNAEVTRRMRTGMPRSTGRRAVAERGKAQLGGAIKSFNEFFEEANRQP